MRTNFETHWKKRTDDIAGYASKPGAKYWFNLGRKIGEAELQRIQSANIEKKLSRAMQEIEDRDITEMSEPE